MSIRTTLLVALAVLTAALLAQVALTLLAAGAAPSGGAGRALGWTSAAVGLGAVILVGGIHLFLRVRVLAPVLDLGREMRDVAEGSQDLTRRARAAREDEIGALAAAFNALLERLQEGLAEAAAAAGGVARAADHIAATSQQQEATATAFGGATGRIAAAVTQISASAEEMAGTMREVAEAARESAASAASGREGLQGMQGTMRGLLDATEGVVRRLRSIDGRAETITDVVTTIVKVADQTNLLSVNAAIEAEKAGEHGRGFLVVSQEIRRLADQTADATLEIERSVRDMQSAVTAGVAEMDRFAGQVRGTVQAATAVAEQMSAVIARVEGLTERFARVNEAMGQQAQGARQIRESTQALRAAARETLDVVGDFTRSTYSLRQSVKALGEGIGRFRPS